jgi:hypothetical protein
MEVVLESAVRSTTRWRSREGGLEFTVSRSSCHFDQLLRGVKGWLYRRDGQLMVYPDELPLDT